jgi:hypothetical protein
MLFRKGAGCRFLYLVDSKSETYLSPTDTLILSNATAMSKGGFSRLPRNVKLPFYRLYTNHRRDYISLDRHASDRS